METLMRQKSMHILSTKLKKRVSFQDIEYLSNKQSPMSSKGNLSIQERKMQMIFNKSYTPTHKNISEAKTNFSSSNKQLLYKKKLFFSLSGKCSFKKIKTIDPSSVVKTIDFDSNDQKEEESKSPIKVNKYKQNTVDKSSLINSTKIEYKNLTNEVDKDKSNKEKLNDKNSIMILKSSQTNSKSLRYFNTIDNEVDANVKLLRYQIEKSIQEIKALDLETYEIDKQRKKLKKEAYDKNQWISKLKAIYLELKESNINIQNEISLLQKKKEEVKSSIIALIKQRLKYKSKTTIEENKNTPHGIEVKSNEAV